MKIYVMPHEDEVGAVDVTEAVQIVYDTLLASMDFSSGFLGIEELTALAKLAEAAGFGDIEDVYSAIKAAEAEQVREQERAYRDSLPKPPRRDPADYRAMLDETVNRAHGIALGRKFDTTETPGGTE